MVINKNWFTEICEECGSAFSMKMKEKLHVEQSPYQKIEVVETESFGTVMVIDGFIMLTDKDNFIYHEMMAHPVLFNHPSPAKVLIIGGGDCGVLREVLKHPEVKKVRQVDIDERVTRLSERYFPELCEANDDPRAELLFDDGIEWVKHTSPNSVDIIIIDSTDPIGPAEGLFNANFYRDCLHILDEGGMIIHQSESPLFHADSIIAPMRAAMCSVGFNHVETLYFPMCSYPSGWWTATVARKGVSICLEREDAAKHKPFSTQYYNLAIHKACTATPEFLLNLT